MVQLLCYTKAVLFGQVFSVSYHKSAKLSSAVFFRFATFLYSSLELFVFVLFSTLCVITLNIKRVG